jgi:hypothetical protein
MVWNIEVLVKPVWTDKPRALRCQCFESWIEKMPLSFPGLASPHRF